MKQLELHTNTSRQYQIRATNHEGKPHIIVPVVMMVEGVHSGSQGPVLHTAQELGHLPQSWNGVPVVVGHPQNQSGHYVSANSPDVIDQEKVGRIYNTRFENGKLKAEAWLEVAKLQQVSPVALARIRQGLPLEVSIGVFTDTEEVAGEFNGEQYVGIARNHRPDHLALLPGEIGACSIEDGCGIRINSTNKNQNANEKVMDENQINQLKQEAVDRIANQNSVTVNAKGFRERLDKVRAVVDAMDNEQRINFLEEVYENEFIYLRRLRNMPQPTETYYKQRYTIANDGMIELVDAPIPVVKNVTFTPLNNNQYQHKRTKLGGKTVETNSKSSCFLGKVERLIQNNQTHFTDEDREWLLTQEEGTLDKLMPKPVTAIEVNSEQALQAFRNTIKTEEDLIRVAPVEMQANLKAAFAANTEKKNSLIETIMANSEKETWTKDELSAMEMNTLEKIAKSTKAPADYSINGGKSTQATSKATEEEPLMY